MRKTTRLGNDQAAAHSPVPTANNRSAPSHTVLVPTRATSQPIVGITAAIASRWALVTQCTAATGAASARPSSGRTTATIVVFSNAAIAPTRSTSANRTRPASSRSSEFAGMPTKYPICLPTASHTFCNLVAMPSAARRPRHKGTSIDGAPVGSLLLQTIRAHAVLGTELLRRAGVLPPHEIVLLYLDENGPVPQTELVHYMGRDRSTVTATLQAMERAGLVERGPSPADGRALLVSLTDKGRATAPGARAAWRELERATTRGLTDAQRAALVELLTIVRDEIGRTIEDEFQDAAPLSG